MWQNPITALSCLIWTASTGFSSQDPVLKTLNHTKIASYALAANGKRMALATDESYITTIDPETLETREQFRTELWRQHTPNIVRLSSTGNLLAAGAPHEGMHMWDSKYLKDYPLVGHPSTVLDAHFMPDETSLITLQDNELGLKLWSTVNGKLLANLSDQTSHHTTVSTTAHERIVTGTQEKEIAVWCPNGKKQLTKTAVHEGSVLKVSGNPENSWCASSSITSTSSVVKVWDVEASKTIKDLTTKLTPIDHLIWWAKAQLLLAASSKHNSVKFWDMRTMREVHEIGAFNPVSSVHITQNNKLIITYNLQENTVHNDHNVKIYNNIAYNPEK